MTEQVRAALIEAIKEETDGFNSPITDETTAADVPGWDSMAHVRIIMNAEQRLKTKFDIASTYDANNVGELVSVLASQM